MSRHFAPRSRINGFSLIELIAVVLILGILSASVTFGLQESAEAARAARTRAELTDMANQAMQRIQRDLRITLPNSPRVDDVTIPGSVFLEMLLIKSAGRFRLTSEMAAGTAVAGNLGAPGTFTDSIASMTGSFGTLKADVAVGDLIVINNAPATPTSAENNAYGFCFPACPAPPNCQTDAATDRCNVTLITGVAPAGTGTRIDFDNRHFAPTMPESALSPVFYVLSNPKVSPTDGSTVYYQCVAGARDAQGDATGRIDRVNRYGMTLTQPTSPAFRAEINRLLDYVESCAITALVGPGQPGIVRVQFTVTRRNESVTVSQEVWVPNS